MSNVEFVTARWSSTTVAVALIVCFTVAWCCAR